MLEEAHKHKGNRKIINIYDNWNLNFDEDLYTQVDELHEDLIQISFIRGYTLDIGWYPEHDEKGQFEGKLIQYEKWDAPIYQMTTNSTGLIVDWLVEVTECVLDFDLKN